MTLRVASDHKRQVLDITADVEAHLAGQGLVNVFLKHTTAALTVADLDPGTDQDYLHALEAMTPAQPWRHPHDPSHFPDHLWAAAIGVSLTLPYKDGKLQLGSWQRLVMIELDGPREREIELSLIKLA
jgi:secondary thiamine-phosphate synthase enzyme